MIEPFKARGGPEETFVEFAGELDIAEGWAAERAAVKRSFVRLSDGLQSLRLDHYTMIFSSSIFFHSLSMH